MRRIITGLLISLLVACSQSTKGVEPDHPIPYSLSTYSSQLPKILFKNLPHDPSIRMICFLSYEREWGVSIAAPENEMAPVNYVIAERSIWRDSHPQDIRVDRTTAHIAKTTAQSLHEAWATVLQHPERMKVRNFNVDGTACRFESLAREGGPISVETWIPRYEYPTGILLELGEMVRDLIQAEASNQPQIESRIRQRSQELLDWYKEINRPKNVTKLTLVAMAPDDIGLTVQKSPVLYFFISPAIDLPIRFTLIDSRKVTPEADVRLKSPISPGLWAIRLEDYHLMLEEEVEYRWYVGVEDPADPLRESFAGGVIERVDPGGINYDGRLCDKDTVRYLRKAGIWYDAFACVTKLIETNPHDRTLRELREKLIGRRSLIYFP
jgi:hypothetical protein